MTFKRISVVLLACLTLSACGGVDPNSPLGQRKAIFKQMLKTGEDLGGMLRGRIPFDGPKFAEGAVKLDALSHEPWKHFPRCAKKITPAPRTMSGSSRRVSGVGPHLEAATGELVIASQVSPTRPATWGRRCRKSKMPAAPAINSSETTDRFLLVEFFHGVLQFFARLGELVLALVDLVRVAFFMALSRSA
jgi:hypothetical protein